MNEFEKLFSYLPESAQCVLISDDINIRYFTKCDTMDACVLAFRDGSRYILCDSRYIEACQNEAKNCTVVLMERKYHQIYELIKKHEVKTCLVESHTMTLEELSMLTKAVTNVKFITSNALSNAIYKCRRVKTQEEIEKIIKAQRIAEKALDITLGMIKPGVTEKEIALSLDYNMRKLGAEGLSFTTIALGGATTSMPHGVPTDKKVKEHEFVLMDFGAVCDGYHSDMTRTVCVGEPTEKMKEVYNIVLEAQKTALSMVKAGVCAADYDKAARDVIERAGYGKCFGHSLGHGVGMEIHEFPFAAPRCKDTILEENNIVTCEPGIYLPGEFGVRIEDFIVIKQNGHENMTLAPKNLIIL